MADRVVVLQAGVIQQVGRPSDVYRHPANLFVATFVGSPPMNLFAGQLVTRDGARAFEGPFTVALAAADWAGTADGPVTLGVRPEEIVLGPAGDPGGVGAVVDLLESVGADSYLSANIGSAVTATVRVDADASAAEGDQVSLHLAPGGIRLFDADGRRIRRAGEAG